MAYSEADTKAKLITPKLKESDWIELHLTREHGFKYFFTDGRKLPDLKLSILNLPFFCKL